jgi:hypothetical protein
MVIHAVPLHYSMMWVPELYMISPSFPVGELEQMAKAGDAASRLVMKARHTAARDEIRRNMKSRNSRVIETAIA